MTFLPKPPIDNLDIFHPSAIGADTPAKALSFMLEIKRMFSIILLKGQCVF